MQERPEPLTRNKYQRWLVFGHPGVGKTRLTATAKSVIVRPPTDHVDAVPASSSAHQWVVESWQDMTNVQEYARHHPKEFDWWWLDSISLFQDYGVDEIFDDAVARKPSRAEFGADKGEYGINMQRLARWVREMCMIDAHFGITAHPFETENPSGDVVLMPYIQGKNMATKICGYMNLVGYLKVVEKNERERRVLFTKQSGRYYAKDLTGAFGKPLADPTIPKMMRLIAQAKKER